MLIPTTSMREYFREALGAALSKQRVPLTETAQAYLVHLLADFGRSENAFAGADHGAKTTLTELYARALDAEPEEAVRIYKHMGDSSLYLSGFFRESAHEVVGRDYYVSMGERAYSSVAGLIRPTAATSSALFDELSARFTALVDLLEVISLHGTRTAEPDAVNDLRLLELVEAYRRTGSQEVLDALQAHGVVLKPGLNADDPNVH